MASSSSAIIATSSSNLPKWNYDVFLSFRGKDTRNTFTSHLHERLQRNKGIITFLDDTRLEKGSTISVELLKAIEESKVAIVIFSEDYASSHWCLDELVHIKKCKNEYNQEVIPVFLGVDPRAVRHQDGSFGKAFAQHESNYNDKVQEWRTALNEVGALSGYEIKPTSKEADCITEIVERVWKIVCKPRALSSAQDVVGSETRLAELKGLLDMETNDVQIVGIWGMGGIGKTTIAKTLFDELLCGTCSYQFDSSFILEDVKQEVKEKGMLSVQNALLDALLGVTVKNKHMAMSVLSNNLKSKKVLIVLDDIDDSEQMENLAGDRGWFGKGSKIFVTTRDKQIIGNADVVYQVTLLSESEAIKLFNQHAFKHEVPDRRFEKLSQEVVNYAQGLPLALKVWGSSLQSTRDIEHWESVVKRMKDCSHSKIEEKLKISFDGLEPQDKEIFLDISCFFRGYQKDSVLEILGSFGFQAIAGLNALIEKCLVFVDDNWIGMHDLIQDMGKHVVELEKELLGECSRIWRCNDFKRVMTNSNGKNHAVKAIRVDDPPYFKISKDAMRNMKNLRMLHIWLKEFELIYDDDAIECLPNSLRCLILRFYPSKSLPPNFGPENIVYLGLWASKLCQLWTEQKELPQLRTMSLRWSKRLKQTPDFTRMRNLEILDLQHCSSLKEVHPSLGYCTNLTTLNLSRCFSLEKVPYSLGDCTNLTKLYFGHCGLKALPSSIKKLQNLEILDLQGCTSLKEVHHTELDLTFCVGLKALPSSIGKELPELPPNIVEFYADFSLAEGSIQNLATKYVKLHLIRFTGDLASNCEEYSFDDLLAKTLTLCISSLRDALSASDSLSQRTITLIHPGTEIPRWFDLEGVATGSRKDPCYVNLPKDWYVRGNFLGFALCFTADFNLRNGTRELILRSNDEELEQQSVTLSAQTKNTLSRSGACFLFVPFNCLWDASKANGKTPNDYRSLKLVSMDNSERIQEIRGHLLYKKPVGTGRSSGHDDAESSSTKQRLHPQQRTQRAMGRDDSEVEKSAQKEKDKKKLLAITPIAKPLAGKKLSKRIFKLVRLATEKTCLKRGVKEVVKSIGRGQKGLCVIAGNISPIDVITHVPILCEEAEIPYIYVASKEDLANAGATKRPTCCVLVQTKPAKGELSQEDQDKLKADYVQVVTEVQELALGEAADIATVNPLARNES